MVKRESVRVLLISPQKRILLFKYHNYQRTGLPREIWATAGGGRDPGETIAQTAKREVFEETGIFDVQLGPVVWYGEDGHRSGDWEVLFQEHFIVALAPTETVDPAGWTDHERHQIMETRWWSLDEVRASREAIYPFGLADLLEPVLAGNYPAEPIVLPRI